MIYTKATHVIVCLPEVDRRVFSYTSTQHSISIFYRSELKLSDRKYVREWQLKLEWRIQVQVRFTSWHRGLAP